MCGIIGLISRKHNGFYQSHAELFETMLQMDTIRGSDSTGVFGVTTAGGVIDILKGNADGYVFTKCKNWTNFYRRISSTFQFVVGHNRAATKGAVTAHNAHPFQEGNITLVHNGTIYNQTDLNGGVEVDSHAIAHALNDHNAADALEKINGAFALAWYDSSNKTLNLARNKQRPLFLVKYDDFWCFASELGLIIWLNRREGRKELGVIDIQPERIYQFRLDKPYSDPVISEYKEYIWKYDITEYHGQKTNLPDKTPTRPIFERPNVVQNQSSGFKTGDTIKVTFYDDKPSEHGGTLFLGHPVIGNEIHNDVLIRYPILRSDPFHKIFEDMVVKYEYFDAKVVSHSVYQGVPIYTVMDVNPIICVKSFNNTYLTPKDVAHVTSAGCPRCKGTITEKDIPSTIVRVKKDGTYRILCPKCLSDSINNAEQHKSGPGLTLVH